LNKILEGPVCFGVGGDFSLRFHLSPKMLLSLHTANLLFEKQVEIFLLLLKQLDKDLPASSFSLG
jgi:hypothetical protein